MTELKICNIVGVRPHFIKYAAIQKAIESLGGIHNILIHTGQHYDYDMSQIHFRGLGLKEPEYHLGARNNIKDIMVGTVKVLKKEKPDIVIVYGDTDSTMGGALAARYCNIPIAHIESGVRNYKNGPEEKYRVLVDGMSTWRFCSSVHAVENLKKEKLDGIFTGDVMLDTLLDTCIGEREQKEPYILMTIHREENTKSQKQFDKLIEFSNQFPYLIIFPIHPRTSHLAKDLPDKIKLMRPLSYVRNLDYIMNAELILTDSGGMQKEAAWLHTPCITLRDETEWPETIEK